jgi:hypothetical protein
VPSHVRTVICLAAWCDHYYLEQSTMVLADLGRKLNAALSSLNRVPIVDEKVCRLLVLLSDAQLSRHWMQL